MFFKFWLAMQMIGFAISPFIIIYMIDLKDEYLIDFLNASKTFSKEVSNDTIDPNHPAGWFDATTLARWFYYKYDIDIWGKDSGFYRKQLWKTIDIYRRCGFIERKCYWNHYIYRVR